MISVSPGYVRNDELHRSLNVFTVSEEIVRFTENYVYRLEYLEFLDNSETSNRLNKLNILEQKYWFIWYSGDNGT